MKNKTFIILLFAILLASCGNGNISFIETKKISDAGWNKDSIVKFVAPITDTTNVFNIYISIRNTIDFPEENLYLFVKTTSPQGNFVVDTINLQLADIYGNWVGKKISRIWDNKFPYRMDVRFPISGNYTFEITQAARFDMLKGVSDVSLQIEEIEQK